MAGLYLRLRKLTTKYLKMGTVTINEFSTDGTMAGNSDSALPTEKAVKTYVDGKALLGNGFPVDVKSVTGTSEVLSGTTGTIVLDIPVGSWIIGYSMNNDVAISDDDGDGTYTAAFTGGLTKDINGGTAIAADKNVKVTEVGNIGVTTDDLSVTLTPNGTTFTGGQVTITVVYMTIDELPDTE